MRFLPGFIPFIAYGRAWFRSMAMVHFTHDAVF
jgi:hypothetical protein